MNAEAKHASVILDSIAKAVANWTVDKHAEAAPQLAERYGATWRADWISHTLAQLHLLAQAVAVRSADLFTESMKWTRESFRARGIDSTDLDENTRCLRSVLASELPAPVDTLVLSYVDASLARAEEAPQGGDGVAAAVQETVVLEYLAAILNGERAAAEALVLGQAEAGLGLADIYEGILAPVQERLGRMWHRGEITVADEHFGSATTQTVMAQLRPRFPRAAANGHIVVATSTPGDLHEIGLRMVADLFEIDGWNVVYLGANTPVADVVELLERRRPHLLALAVSTALTLRDAGALIEGVRARAALAATRILVGGPTFRMVPDLWRELGADGCALSASEAVKVGNRLVASTSDAR
ncbi:MAG TPA: cobalamin-dependent protein [Phycisphaerae bacterium]|nr:cobalamin B12-binding domain-containing protein [Phycisphaerales bacterium]HRX85086.1 cobalamin-dependent protein [Phycisphaerae bacterium]